MFNTKISVYTDGSTSGNQSKENFGGWGYVIAPFGKNPQIEDYGSAINTSNNKMELHAPIEALRFIESNYGVNTPVEVFSDSAYMINGITNWIHGWKQRGWTKADKKPVENADYWKELDELVNAFRKVTFTKVKGHSGVPMNELADKLATQGTKEAKARHSQ